MAKVELGRGGTYEYTKDAEWYSSFKAMHLEKETASKATYEDSDGNLIIMTGSKFTDSDTSKGVVTDVRIEDDHGVMVYDISGLSLSFATLSSIATQATDSAVINVLQQTLAGDDRIHGTKGSDELVSAQNGGNNIVKGYGGDDIFRAGPGNNTLDGGRGTDELNYSITYPSPAQTQGVVVDATKGKATNPWGGHDHISGFEVYYGTTRDDTFKGSSADETFTTGGGADTVDGRGGFDTVDYSTDYSQGGTKGIVVNLAAGTATDGFGNAEKITHVEAVIGTSFADQFIGSQHADTFTAGAGNDTLTGGFGGDTFIFADHFGSDTITDFNTHGKHPDHITFANTILTDFHDVKEHWDTYGDNVVINLGLDKLTLVNVDIHHLHKGMFDFSG